MDLLDDLTCPVCMKSFKTKRGRSSHLRSAASCRWYRLGKMAELLPLDLEGEGGEMTQVDIAEEFVGNVGGMDGMDQTILQRDEWEQHPEAIMDDLMDYDDLFHFIPLCSTPPPIPDIGEAGPGPSTSASTAKRLQHRVLDDVDESHVEDPFWGAGMVVQMDQTLHEKWKRRFASEYDQDGDAAMEDRTADDGYDSDSRFHPFASELDWRVANWVIKESPGNKAFDRLLGIPGVRIYFKSNTYNVSNCSMKLKEKLGLSFANTRALHQIVDGIPDRAGKWKTKNLSFKDRLLEKHTIRYRNIVDAIKCLWGDPALSKYMVYAPKKVFSDASRETRIYNEMWTGSWWHVIQVHLHYSDLHVISLTTFQACLSEGSTLAPLIIATDKMQLTQFSGGKSAYPVYLTLGNLPKAIRRKPSHHACVLIGYLSVDKIRRYELTNQEHCARNQRLFHESMRVIMAPLMEAGKDGILMTGGDGCTRRVYPILAAYVADYPEQCLVSCSKYGTCPKCQCPHDKLQDPGPSTPRTQKWTSNVISNAKGAAKTTSQFHKMCMDDNVSGSVYKPFWEGLPHTDIHTAITPDVLHQIYQGVFKHLTNWCRRIMDEGELDKHI